MKTIYVDNTLLCSLVCDTKALVRHGYGYTVETEAPKLMAGKAAHAAVEAILKGGTAEAALAVWERDYAAWARERQSPDSNLGAQHTTDIMRAYLTDFTAETLPLLVRPEHVEVGFQVPLTADVLPDGSPEFVFYGRFDVFGESRHRPGQWWVLDHKFTGRVDSNYMADYGLDSQLSGYVWAARQQLGRQVVGAYVQAVQLFYPLPGSDRKCAKHGVTYVECRELHLNVACQEYRRTEAALADWHRTAVALARRYKSLLAQYPTLDAARSAPQQGMFRKSCRYCHFKDWCESGRPEWASSILKYDPWAPFNVEEKNNEVA
jgi:hypothetical protein